MNNADKKLTQQQFGITFRAMARKNYDWGNVQIKILFLDIYQCFLPPHKRKNRKEMAEASASVCLILAKAGPRLRVFRVKCLVFTQQSVTYGYKWELRKYSRTVFLVYTDQVWNPR